MTGYDTDMVPDLALQMRYQEATGRYWFGRATLGDLALSPVPSQLVAKPITNWFDKTCVTAPTDFWPG